MRAPSLPSLLLASVALAGCLKIPTSSDRPTDAATDREILADAMQAEYDKAHAGDPPGILAWASTVTAVHRNDLQDEFPEADWEHLADLAQLWLADLERESSDLRLAIEAMRAEAHLRAARSDKPGTLAEVDEALDEVRDYRAAMRSLEVHAALGEPLESLDDVCQRTRQMARTDDELYELVEVCRELSPGAPGVDAFLWLSEADRGTWERLRQLDAGMEAYRRARDERRRARERDRATMLEQYGPRAPQ